MPQNYTKDFKERMVQKVLINPTMTLSSIAQEAGIPYTTLLTWREKYCQSKGVKLSNKSKKKKNWSPKDKFEAVIKVASMSEIEKSEYCRQQGIYTEELEQWEKDCIAGCRNNPDKKLINKTKKQKKELEKKTKHLEKELRRKDKALAETAALLVLKKKAQEIWGEPEEEE